MHLLIKTPSPNSRRDECRKIEIGKGNMGKCGDLSLGYDATQLKRVVLGLIFLEYFPMPSKSNTPSSLLMIQAFEFCSRRAGFLR